MSHSAGLLLDCRIGDIGTSGPGGVGWVGVGFRGEICDRVSGLLFASGSGSGSWLPGVSTSSGRSRKGETEEWAEFASGWVSDGLCRKRYRGVRHGLKG